MLHFRNNLWEETGNNNKAVKTQDNNKVVLSFTVVLLVWAKRRKEG